MWRDKKLWLFLVAYAAKHLFLLWNMVREPQTDGDEERKDEDIGHSERTYILYPMQRTFLYSARSASYISYQTMKEWCKKKAQREEAAYRQETSWVYADNCAYVMRAFFV